MHSDVPAEVESARLIRVGQLISQARELFSQKPFRPHPLFRSGHAQTLGAYAWRRPRHILLAKDEERVFDVAPDVKVLAHCRWQSERHDHPTMIIWHGIEGSSASAYMLGTAEKAFAVGFNVIRMNLRTCGDTEHLTPTIYHGGLTDDLREVVRQLIEKDKLTRLFLIGFSLGGNMVLKLAGEYSEEIPDQVSAVAAISPSVDLIASAELILKRSNWIYHREFVYRLKKRIRTKHKLFPEQYDISGLWKIQSLRAFDDRFTSRAHGFAGADDYYYRASALRVIDRVRVPTLILHAQDDPFIPFAPLKDPAVTNNPYILLIDPPQGGHVAFLSDLTQTNGASPDPDRFWAENRLVDFCRLVNEFKY